MVTQVRVKAVKRIQGKVRVIHTFLNGHGEGYVDSSDATATAEDMADGVTAYAQGEKITGTVKKMDFAMANAESVSYSDGKIRVKGTIGRDKRICNPDATMTLTTPADAFGDAEAADVAAGKTFTSVSGLKITGTRSDADGADGTDTSDATAEAIHIEEGETAYVKRQKITGTLTKAPQISGPAAGVSRHEFSGNIMVKGNPGGKYIVNTDTVVTWTVPKADFGDAAAEDVAKGKTFTSASGLKVTGIHVCEGGVDTSDATAAAYDMASGKTAYINGEKVTGTLTEMLYDETEEHKIYTSGDFAKVTTSPDGKIVSLGRYFAAKIGDNTTGVILRPGAILGTRMPPEIYGDAAASDVMAGKTFTSAAGLLVTGTAKAAVFEVTDDGQGNVTITASSGIAAS